MELLDLSLPPDTCQALEVWIGERLKLHPRDNALLLNNKYRRFSDEGIRFVMKRLHRTATHLLGDPTSRLVTAASVSGEWERTRNIALLYLLRDTGARIGALVNARLDDLDLDGCELAAISKGKTGMLFFNAPTREALRLWLEQRDTLNPQTESLFTNDLGGPLTREGARRILDRAAKRGGVEGERINPHAFRHAFARDLLRSHQADLSTVSRLMWHSGVTITADYYARWDGAELKRIHTLASPGANLPMPSQTTAEGNHE